MRFRKSGPKQSALRDWVDDWISELRFIYEMLDKDLEDESFRQWFYEKGDRVEVFGETVVHGSSPLDGPEIVDLLGWCGIQYRGTYRTDVESLIIGRDGWQREEVMQQLDLRTGKTVKVYWQAMVLAFLGCGKDPLDGSEALLRYFSHNHPGLEFLASIGFP